MARESRYYDQAHILRRLNFKARDLDMYKTNSERLSFRYKTTGLPHYDNFTADAKRRKTPLKIQRGRLKKPKKQTSPYAEEYMGLDLERQRRLFKTKQVGQQGLQRMYRYFDTYTP